MARKRGGRVAFSPTLSGLTGDGSISGLFVFRLDGSASGTVTFYIATEGTTVQSFTTGGSGAWTDRSNGVGLTTNPRLNADCFFATLLNTLVMTCGWGAAGTPSVVPQKWNGTDADVGSISVAPLGTGIPDPTGARYCCAHNSSMFYANTPGNTSGLWKSAVGTVDTWDTANDTFFQNVYAGDGDVIRAIAEVGRDLVIAKRNHLYVMYGANFDQYTILPHPIATRGLASDRGWAVYGSLFCYASEDGIYAAGPNSFTELSVPFKDAYLDISDKTTIAAGTYRDQVWFAFADTGSTVNNAAFVVDLRRGSWAKYVAIPVRVFYRDVDGALYEGLSTAGTTTRVMQADQGTTDEGTAITQIVETRDVDFKAFAADKVLGPWWAWVKPLASGTLTVYIYVDGVAGGSPYPVSYAMDKTTVPTGGTTLLIRDLAPQTARGKLMRIRLTNSDTGQTEFYGVAMDADILEPVQSDV